MAYSSAFREHIHNTIVAHGVLMVVALTIFLPLSVVVAHAMRDTWGSRLWFQIHRSANVMVLAVVAAGVALGIYLWTVFAPVKHALLLAHMIIGLIIFAFLVVQASAALFVRPQPKSRYRGAWNWVHHSMGYTLLLVALANAFIGLYLGKAGWGWYLAVAVVWCVIVAAGTAKSLYERRRGRYPAGTLATQ